MPRPTKTSPKEEPEKEAIKTSFEFQTGDNAYSFLFGWVTIGEVTKTHVTLIIQNGREQVIPINGRVGASLSFTKYDLVGITTKRLSKISPGQWAYFRDKGNQEFTFACLKVIRPENTFPYETQDGSIYEECYADPPIA